MKTNISFILTLLIFLAACQSDPGKGSYVIEGETNVKNGTVYLQDFRNKMFFVIDSAEITDGQFRFEGSVERPDLYGLTLNKEESFSPQYIFLENSPVTVKLDSENRRNNTVSGSATHELFTEYQKADKRSFDLDSFITANPASIVSAYILYRDYSYRLEPEQIRNYLNILDPSLENTQYVEVLNQHIQKLENVAVGKKAPDFPTITPDGENLTLYSRLGNGYLLLDFWASWCGPCRRENPVIVEAYQQFHSKGFDILAVSLDKDRDAWLAAIEKDNLTWAHGSDLKFWDSEPAQLYGVRAIPSNFLLDKDGNIIAKNLRGEELKRKLAELLP